MSNKNSRRFLTTEAVLADHGGEIAFWSRWLAGELPKVIMDWACERADDDASFQRWLGVVNSTQADKARAFAFAIGNVLVDNSLPSSADDVTRKVTQTGPAGDCPDIRDQLRRCLFELLDEVELPHPAETRVQKEATRLLNVLVGQSAVKAFNQFGIWLDKMRLRIKTQATRLDRLLTWLTPELVEEEAGRLRYRLSYRLFMRDRFYRYAVRRAWTPTGPRFDSLAEAFHALTRERLGELARTALAECDAPSLRRGWQMACIDGTD